MFGVLLLLITLIGAVAKCMRFWILLYLFVVYVRDNIDIYTIRQLGVDISYIIFIFYIQNRVIIFRKRSNEPAITVKCCPYYIQSECSDTNILKLKTFIYRTLKRCIDILPGSGSNKNRHM